MSRPITKKETKELISEYLDLNGRIKREPIDPNDSKKDKIEKFVIRDKNAFVFKIPDIERFKDATHLLVIHGAHPRDESADNIVAGSYTILTMGCKEAAPNDYKAVDSVHPANQYPGKTAIDEEFKTNDESGPDSDTIYYSL